MFAILPAGRGIKLWQEGIFCLFAGFDENALPTFRSLFPNVGRPMEAFRAFAKQRLKALNAEFARFAQDLLKRCDVIGEAQ
jgi:hypothetical protein